MHSLIKAIVCLTLLTGSLLALNKVSFADDQPVSTVKIFKNQEEAYDFVIQNKKLINIGAPITGTSDALIGSADKAIKSAVSQIKVGYAFTGKINQQVMKTWFGQAMNYVVDVYPVTMIEITDSNLENQLKNSPRGSYFDYLIDLAQKPEYKNLTQNYREYIRNYNIDEYSHNLINLTDLIIFHEGKDCGDDLKKWAKYHKNRSVRKAAYLGLLKFGRTAEVEEILKDEPNFELKSEVQKKLL